MTKRRRKQRVKHSNSGTGSERQLLKPAFYFCWLLFLPEISGASGGELTDAGAEEGGSGRGQWETANMQPRCPAQLFCTTRRLCGGCAAAVRRRRLSASFTSCCERSRSRRSATGTRKGRLGPRPWLITHL